MTGVGSAGTVEGAQRAVLNKRPFLATVSPVARVLGLFLFTTPLLIFIDQVSAVVALVCTFFLVPLSGLGSHHFLGHNLPLLITISISGISMTLHGNPGDKEYFSFLFVHVTDNSISLVIAIMLCVLAIGTSVIVLIANISPIDLGNGLAQILRSPSRFVLAVMVNLRLVGLFISNWQALTRARRAHGLGDHDAIRRTIPQMFALLMFTLRRGTKLVMAMETRSFDVPIKRTRWHTSTLAGCDYVTVAAYPIIAIATISTSVWAGEFRFLGVA